MFDIFPLNLYYPIYVNLSLVIVVMMLLNSYILPINDQKNISYTNFIGYLFLFFSIYFIGTRAVSGRYFGDMVTYNRYFTYYSQGGEAELDKDAFFHYFMKFCSYFLHVKVFFTVCFILYVYPLYRISRVFFKEYWFYSFLMFAVSFSFWTYGTNGIRNGIATSIFLLAVSFYRNKVLMISFLFLSSLIHQTLLLPILAFIGTFFYQKSKSYLIFWFVSIPLSIVLGGFWESLFASLGFGDERLGAYLVGEVDKEAFSSTGFRYDFLLYSAGAVYVGWYFIFKRNFTDKIYLQLYHTYLVCNAFWVLVIRANFSNRFAYLSWFMMGLIIIYPYLRKQFFSNQHMVIGKVITVYFMFTYLMYYVYYAK